MEKKNSLFIRYMKYWYGIYGPLDEYRRSEVERIGNNAFFMTYFPMTFVMLLSIVVDNLHVAYKTNLAYIIMLFGWLILELISNFYISHQLKELKLQVYEVDNDQIASVKKGIWIVGLILGLLITVLFVIIFNQEILSFMTLIEFLILTIALSLISGFRRASYIKVVEDDE